MDDKWFKRQKKIAGVTDADIAERLGRDRSVVSKIVSGQQRMSLEWARAFADALKVPVAEVLEQAGVATATQAQELRPGFSESDVAIWAGPGPNQRDARDVAEFFGARPGVDVWRVKNHCMVLAGLIPGDYILVDTHQAETAKPNDIVVAQIYSRDATAKTVLRRWVPPVLISTATPLDHEEVHLVDNDNVVIMGKVIASWRDLRTKSARDAAV